MFLIRLLGLLFTLGLQAVDLQVVEKTISVNGQQAQVFAITQPDGTLGLQISKAQPFDVQLKNDLEVPTSLHWHGLILPNEQDGVAFVTQYPIYPKQSYHYQFPLVQSGTFWMHSHVGLQEQKLLSAPLIITDPEETSLADQEVVLLLTDFTFKSPSVILEKLRCQNAGHAMAMDKPDVVEVDYDALLTNYKTLEAPDTVEVTPGKKVRLRIIDGASATNFHIDLGQLKGEAIAVDGNRIQPFSNSRFELAVAQRIDLIVQIPEAGGAFPILAQGEGTNLQTGLLLHTNNATLPKLSGKALHKADPLTNAQESTLRALNPLSSKAIDKRLIVDLGGNMANYLWTINGQAWPESTPLIVDKGQRVEMVFKNPTTMSHPMHLHGHVFQVKSINGKPFEGALRDTILVMPNSSVTVQFDADNPGVWPLHCHILYHMEAGMFTVLRYSDFIQPLICK